MITISRPKAVAPKKRYSTSQGKAYNLAQMNSNDFANMIYWVYKTEVNNGSFAKLYDDIAIMRATRDFGRDCVLYQNGVMKGAIQCKHTTSTATMTEDVFLKEFSKFILYSVKFPSKVALVKDFVYYVASSGGFDEKVINLMKDLNSICIHPKFKRFAKENIKSHMGLNGLVYTKISQQLTDAVKILKLERIDSAGINILLHQNDHLAVVKTFFDVKMVIDEESATELKDGNKELIRKLKDIKKQINPKIPIQPIQLPQSPNRIPRTIQSPRFSFADIFDEQQVTLFDSILEHKHIAFLGWGLSGKSVELAHAAHLLSEPSLGNHVFFTELKYYKGQDITEYVPEFEQREHTSLIVFLDGLDEVPPIHYATALSSIQLFHKTYPDVRMIVSCRVNFYLEDENPDHNTLPGFSIIKLKDLNESTVSNYLNALSNFDVQGFEKKVYDAKLENLIHIPYYLIHFTERFADTGNIYADKGEMYEDIINKAIKKDIDKYHKTQALNKRKEARPALEKIAYITELQGKNIFTTAELETIFRSDIVELILQCGELIKGDASKGEWSFFHQNAQEYLAAKVLSKKGYSFIEPLLINGSSNKAIKPAMINTISFLVGIAGKNSEMRTKLIELLSRSEPAVLMQFEAGYLDDSIRETVFQDIFNYYKSSKREINQTRFAIRQLAAFSQTENNIDFLIQVVQQSEEINVRNALDVLVHYELAEYPIQFERLENHIKSHLSTASNDIKFKMVFLLIYHRDFDKVSFQYIFDELASNPYTHLRALLFTAIDKFRLELIYRDFIIRETAFLVDEEWKRYSSNNTDSRSGTESQMLKNIWINLTDADSVNKRMELIKNNYEAFEHSIIFKEFIKNALEQATKYPNNFNLYNFASEIYIENFITISHNSYINDSWIQYFSRLCKRLETCKRLVKAYHTINYQTAKGVAELCDEECIEYFAKQVSNGFIQPQEAETLQWRLGNINENLATRFNNALDPSIQLASYKVVDHNKFAEELHKLKAETLFTKSKLLFEIQMLFQIAGKQTISYDDLHYLSPGNHLLSQYYYWLFSCIDYKGFGSPGYTFSAIQQFESLNSYKLFPSRVYDLMHDNPKAKFSDAQIAEIQEWCLFKEQSLDFTRHPSQTNYGVIKHSDETAFVYFIRNLPITGFQKVTYLNMLKFYDNQGKSEKLYEFLTKFIPITAMKTQVLKNLSDINLSRLVLPDHVEFAVKYNLKTAVKALLNQLKTGYSSKWEDMLSAYIVLEGDVEELYQMLATTDVNNRHHLYKALKSIDTDKLHAELKNLFNRSNTDKKNELTSILVELGDTEAFAHYVDLIKTSTKLPEILHVHHKFRMGYTRRFTAIALELLEFSFLSPFQSNFTYSPLAIAYGVLGSIARDLKNYPEFIAQFKEFIDSLRQQQSPNMTKLIENLERRQEEWDHIYLQNNTVALTFDEAIDSFNALTKI
ncbi:NACHT domain-containing protein [Pedobacter sp. GR22-6]|uniref:NACHT domain-containing protein n=1 Tax=Pedobacter sp. GR22-6 TaxID=3127957 RepID=UPI00307F2B4C